MPAVRRDSKQAETGDAPTNKELRVKVRQLTPRKTAEAYHNWQKGETKSEPPL